MWIKNPFSHAKLSSQFTDEMAHVKDIYRDFILSSEFCSSETGDLTWENYESWIFRGLYLKEYIELLNKRQYSFLLRENKGFIQVYCAFDADKNIVKKAKMAFYPHPLLVSMEDTELWDLFDDADDSLSAYTYDLWEMLDSDIYSSTDEDAERISQKFKDKYPLTNSSHIRLDYDPEVSSHHICEMQFGSINNVRLPISKLVSPFVFVDFIIKNVYRDRYKSVLNKKHAIRYKYSRKMSIGIPGFSEENLFFTHP